jgi:hypothetical protein
MNGDEMQMTSDPTRIDHVHNVKGLKGRISVEMHSGLEYAGDVVGSRDWNTSGANQPNRSGAYIRLQTADGVFRLDALDIKSWS